MRWSNLINKIPAGIHPLQYSIWVSPAIEGKATVMLTMVKMRNWLVLRLADLFPRSHFLRTPAGGQHWRQQLIWYGMVCFHMFWYGMVCFDIFWYVFVLFGMVWYVFICFGMVWYGMVYRYVSHCAMVWDQVNSSTNSWEISPQKCFRREVSSLYWINYHLLTLWRATHTNTSPHKKFQE